MKPQGTNSFVPLGCPCFETQLNSVTSTWKNKFSKKQFEGDFPNVQQTTIPMKHRDRHPLSMREWLCGKTDDVTCGSRIVYSVEWKPYSIAFSCEKAEFE